MSELAAQRVRSFSVGVCLTAALIVAMPGCGQSGTTPVGGTGGPAAKEDENSANPASAAGSRSGNWEADTTVALKADIAEALRLHDTGQHALFLLKYAPVDELRSVRRQESFGRTARAMGEGPPEVRAKFSALCRELQSQTPRFEQSGGVAVFEFDYAPAVTEPVPPAEVAAAPTAVERGFGGDLKVVLSESAAVLERGEHAAFVARMYPPAEAARFAAPDQQEAFAAHLKETPGLAERMIADLRALAGMTPEITDGETIAAYTLTPDDGPPRTVKFQKFGEDWRFFDGSTRVNRSIGDMARLPARSYAVRVEFELIGGNWRFLKFDL